MDTGMIVQALNATRVPSSQVMAVLYGYLDQMRRGDRKGEAERIASKIMRDRRDAIRYHQAAKVAIVLSSMRELVPDASQIDDFLAQMDAQEEDRDLVEIRRGLLVLARTAH